MEFDAEVIENVYLELSAYIRLVQSCLVILITGLPFSIRHKDSTLKRQTDRERKKERQRD
jgi:hypothetical protein